MMFAIMRGSIVNATRCGSRAMSLRLIGSIAPRMTISAKSTSTSTSTSTSAPMFVRRYTTQQESKTSGTTTENIKIESNEEQAPLIDFAKMKEIALSKDSNYVIVDVREPDEFVAGHIPGAINIPVKSAPGALGLYEDEFKLRFGFDKPNTDKTLVFYCLAGVRATMAEELAYTFGYNKRLNYAGSFGNWVEQNGAIEIPAREAEETSS